MKIKPGYALPISNIKFEFVKSLVTLTYLTIFSLLLNIATSYNIDERFPVIKQGAEGSLFGLAVSQHHLKAKVSSLDEVTLLVGAPKAKTTRSSIVTGGLFKCPISSQTDDCKLVDIDKTTSDNIPQDDQWLGVTVESEKPGGKIGVCAHRWEAFKTPGRKREIDSLFGKCFILMSDGTPIPSLAPLKPCTSLNSDSKVSVDKYKYCQAGTSFAFEMGIKGEACYIGMPGSYGWKGTIGSNDLRDDMFINTGLNHISNQTLNNFGIPRNSYLGFSITTGVFLSGQAVYVTGAPRLDETGAIVLAYTNRNTMSLQEIIYGELVASAFGYAVELVDINGDGRQDLIVGAPQYYDRIRDFGGAVYVYLNKGIDRFETKYDQKIPGGIDSTFGNSITNCGDLNMDGINDVAIGAPGADDGSGVVYIYHGGSDVNKGLKESPAQVIKATALYENGLVSAPLIRFGYSLNGGLDMDLNKYPDLLVGSLSDVAILFRSRPIINIQAFLNSTQNSLVFDNEKSNKVSPVIDVCMNYTSLPGYNEVIEIYYNLTLDSKTKLNQPRVSFKKYKSHSVYESKLKLTGQSKLSCSEVPIYLQKNIVDKLSPINILLAYHIKEAKHRSKRDVVSLSNYPVLNNDLSKNVSLSLNISKDCGTDYVCNSNLQFNCKYVEKSNSVWKDFPKSKDDIPVLVLGKQKDYGISFEVSNTGEAAHQSKLMVSLPFGANFDGVTLDQLLSFENGTYVEFDLGNPLKTNEKLSFVMTFSTSSDLLLDDKLFTKMHIQTSSTQAPIKDVELLFKVQVEAHLEVLSSANPPQIRPSGVVIGESAVKKPSDVGITIVHSYELHNRGTTDLENLKFQVSWPSQLQNQKWLFYFLEHKLAEVGKNGSNSLVCDIPSKLNPLNLKLEEDSNRKKRDLNGESSPLSLKNPQSKSNTNHSNIVCPKSDGCVDFTCDLSHILAGEKISIDFYAVVWNSTFIEEFNRLLYTVSVGSSLRLDNSKNVIKYTSDSITSSSVSTDVISSYTKPKQQTNFWVIAAAALAGIIVLVLLILILWRCGFFQRKRGFGGFHKARYHKQASKSAEEASQQILYK